MHTSEALDREQEQLRQVLLDVQRRMLDLGRSLPPRSPARLGWFERASVVDDLVGSIPQDRAVGELAWRTVPHGDV